MNDQSVLFGDSIDVGNMEPIPVRDRAEDEAPGCEDVDMCPLPLDGVALGDQNWVGVYFSFLSRFGKGEGR